jgi:glycosyltransferase involved in cell wall biosynthesis
VGRLSNPVGFISLLYRGGTCSRNYTKGRRMKFSIICAVNKEDVLNKNLLSSKDIYNHQVILQRDCNNICIAYNEAMKQATEDIVIFIHQDVYLPDNFFSQLETSLQQLEGVDWGVLGVAGIKGKDGYTGYILDRGKIWGTPSELPRIVETLDELLLIIKKDSFRFDENLTSQHLFGADICLQATSQNKKNFAINGFCHHNSYTQNVLYSDLLPQEFQDAKEYLKNKWINYLPIYTTCTVIK